MFEGLLVRGNWKEKEREVVEQNVKKKEISLFFCFCFCVHILNKTVQIDLKHSFKFETTPNHISVVSNYNKLNPTILIWFQSDFAVFD